MKQFINPKQGNGSGQGSNKPSLIEYLRAESERSFIEKQKKRDRFAKDIEELDRLIKASSKSSSITNSKQISKSLPTVKRETIPKPLPTAQKVQFPTDKRKFRPKQLLTKRSEKSHLPNFTDFCRRASEARKWFDRTNSSEKAPSSESGEAKDLITNDHYQLATDLCRKFNNISCKVLNS
jgi:hypothetical protein